MRDRMRLAAPFALCAMMLIAGQPAEAKTVKVGVILSLTGPGASLGIPEKKTFELAPVTDGKTQLDFIYLDDASDPATARRDAERFINVDKVDVIVGPSLTTTSLAVVEAAAGAKTPMISLASSARIIEPMNDQHHWIFKIPYSDYQLARTLVRNMRANGVKTVGFIGFADAYGESWYSDFSKEAQAAGLKLVASERYDARDTSVTAQALKLLAAQPDAVLIAASGTPAVAPEAALAENGYRGRLYQTAGVINRDFLRVGGKILEGTLLPGGPLIVSNQLPDDHPSKLQAEKYRKAYEGAYGPNSLTTFGANAWDATLLLLDASGRTAGGEPGTSGFRAALRDAIEQTDGLKTSLGVIHMSPDKHLGFSDDAPVMIKIHNGDWLLVPAGSNQ